MNVFVLNPCPKTAAQDQCDKHVPKMTVESAQMLSTAHRVLDGALSIRPSKSGKTNVKYWDLFDGVDDLEAEMMLYKAVHVNHPCTVWTRQSSGNYIWHWRHFEALCSEYTYRFGKVHKSEKLLQVLRNPPINIPLGDLTDFPLAMKSNPECMFPKDAVKSYRLFYQTKQTRFKMLWERGRSIPNWFKRIAS